MIRGLCVAIVSMIFCHQSLASGRLELEFEVYSYDNGKITRSDKCLGLSARPNGSGVSILEIIISQNMGDEKSSEFAKREYPPLTDYTMAIVCAPEDTIVCYIVIENVDCDFPGPSCVPKEKECRLVDEDKVEDVMHSIMKGVAKW